MNNTQIKLEICFFSFVDWLYILSDKCANRIGYNDNIVSLFALSLSLFLFAFVLSII